MRPLEWRDKPKSPFTNITTSSSERVLPVSIAFLLARKMICSQMLNSIAFAVLLLLPRLLIHAVYDIGDIIEMGFQVCDNEIGCIQKITGGTDVLLATSLSKKVSCIKSGLMDRTLRTVPA